MTRQSAFEIKTLRWRDFFRTLKLHNRACDPSQHSIWKMFNRFLRGGLMLKACDGRKIVAYIVLNLDASAGRSWINMVVTDPDYQGCGLAAKLIGICIYSQFFPEIALLVDAQNDRAVRLYRHLGFTVIRTSPAYYPNGHDGLEMVRGASDTI